MEQQNNKFTNWLKSSNTAKMIMTGILSFVLLIPLMYIENLIDDRAHLQKGVVNEISQKWGGKVQVFGPILKIPYKVHSEKIITNKKTKEVTTEVIEHQENAYFFPDQLQIKAVVNPEIKKRGIYTSAVYNSSIDLSGNFTTLNFKKGEIKEENILWNKAKVIFKTTNVKGINTNLIVLLNDKKHKLSSTINSNRNRKFSNLESDFIALKEVKKGQKNIHFSLLYDVKGSEEMKFIPIGKETNAQIKSSWKTAKFTGEFLPFNSDKISENGFHAKWKVLDVNRPFSQEYFNNLPELNSFNFGVDFKIPVDEYQKSLRSAKYGYLIISLTFLVFFLIESINKINMHAFHYLMIGFALLMFYTLLVSISEHSNFLKAYSVASVAVISLITIYTKSILKNSKITVLVSFSLVILYLFIFVIIQLESYALLVGSLGLFIILAAVMMISRKIKWS